VPWRKKTGILHLSLVLAFLGGGVWFWNCVPSPLFYLSYSTVLLDRNAELLGAVTARDEQWRFPPIKKVPEKIAEGVVCFEDRRFYGHFGVDPFSVLRAVVQNLRARSVVSGASTITMQVIRLSRARPRSVGEKIIEMLMALRLELSLDKEEILALYASHAPYGGNVVGVEAASWRYFGRPPMRLSWAESALLAVLPNNPALIHPGRNREKLLEKRNRLLDRMHGMGKIDGLTCRLAKAEPLPPRPFALPRLAPHLMGRLISEQNQSPVSPCLYRSTLVKNLQERATELVLRHGRELAGNGIHNAAAIIMEVETGEVSAYVGNVSDFNTPEHANQVDIIAARRSPGSLLKPLLYAAMLEAGDLLPTELVPDIPTRLGGFAPENYSRTYQGAVPASMALARSLNVPAVKMLQSYGVDRFCRFLKKLGITTLHRPAHEYGLSLILGGSEATLWDLTAAYAGMAKAARGGPAGFEELENSFFISKVIRREPGRTIHCDASLKMRVHDQCERIEHIVRVKWFVLPPAMEWYYRKNHLNYRPLPPFRHDCLASMALRGPEFMGLIYPEKSSQIYVPIELSGRRGRVVFEAAHWDPNATIYWHLDDRYVGSTREIHQMALAPAPGSHMITLVDQDGEQIQRRFTVLGKE